jgi:hypothetical protein
MVRKLEGKKPFGIHECILEGNIEMDSKIGCYSVCCVHHA